MSRELITRKWSKSFKQGSVDNVRIKSGKKGFLYPGLGQFYFNLQKFWYKNFYDRFFGQNFWSSEFFSRTPKNFLTNIFLSSFLFLRETDRTYFWNSDTSKFFIGQIQNGRLRWLTGKYGDKRWTHCNRWKRFAHRSWNKGCRRVIFIIFQQKL